MGKVVNKSFNKVRQSIAKKSDKLLLFLQDNNGILFDDWSRNQNKTYEKLSVLCDSLLEEISNLDEIDVPEYNNE